MHLLWQSLRMTWRDWRAGELRFLLLALMIAVGALSSVNFFVDRVSYGLQRNANQLLGADLVLISDKPISSNLRNLAKGFEQAETVSFVSMAMNAASRVDQALGKLVSVKAVSVGYPLRGHLTLETGDVSHQIPAPGTIWVDQALLSALDSRVGQQLKLGNQLFTVSHIINNEPDRGSSFMSFAPRVMLALSDLPSTELIRPGSRVTYRLMLSGASADINAAQRLLEQEIEHHQLKGVSLESLASGRPEMNSMLGKAKQFLDLVSLLSAMLAALAIVLASRRFMLRHTDSCALLRCLGATQRQITLMYLFEFITLGTFASALGAVLGYLGHLALLILLGSFISTSLSLPSVLPALQGIAIGLLLLIGFALPPILQLRNVSHNLMIRREAGAPQAHTISVYLLGITGFALLLFWQTGNIKLAAYTLSIFMAGFVVFAVCAWMVLRLTRYMRGWSQFPSWRFAINSLQRRIMAGVVQVVSLSLGLMALLLLTVVCNDLLLAWRQSTPEGTPNQFVINIMNEEKKAISALLQQHQIPIATFYPMIRARLTSVNDVSISAKDYEAENAKRLVDREFNVSTMEELQSHNRLISGQWFTADPSNSKAEASVEEGIAKTLSLKLGDKLRFESGGQDIDVNITSIRKLKWDSMQVNFFVIIDPHTAAELPQTWITAFYLPLSQQRLLGHLSQQFPHLTIVDTSMIINQLRGMLDQVTKAIEFLFLFTLASGFLVLYAALESSQQERLREVAILRTLGASRNQLARAQWIEFGLLGSLAGLLASTGAAIVGKILADQIFEFVFQPSLLLWLIGLIVGVLCALICGWIGLRPILNQPPLLSLREG